MATSTVKYCCLILYHCLILALHLRSACTSHIIRGSDGGYSKIVIAIPERVKEIPDLNDVLLKYFTEVSKTIYNATRNRAFLKEIQILVPESWTSSSNAPNATFETYYDADIRLDDFNPSKEKGNLYTQQPRGCEERGDFIYLNTSFLRDWYTTNNEKAIQQFVQEWAKFKYGIFEEHGRADKLFPNTYKNNSGQYDTGCNTVSNGYSIMDNATYHGKLFCEHIDHNYLAPNRQNALCKLKNTWDIVNASKDFTDTHGQKINFVSPVINFVKPSPMEVTLIIDPSLWNMNSENFVKFMVHKLTLEIPEGSKLNCIFATENPEKHFKRNRNVFSDIETLVRSINTMNTNLTAAIELAKSHNFISNTTYLIIISTAEELSRGKMLPSLQIMNKINLFLFTLTSPEKKLNYFIYDLTEFMSDSSRRLWVNIETEFPVNNYNAKNLMQAMEAVTLFVNKFGQKDFFPDSIKIKDYSMKSNVEEILILPSSDITTTVILNVYDCNPKVASLKLKLNGILVSKEPSVPDTCTITWKREVNSRKITFKFTNSTETIEFTCSVWLKTAIDARNFNESNILGAKIEKLSRKEFSTQMVVYAFNPKNYSLIAEMTDENGNITNVDLRDNGNGDPDVLAGDKIYSRYFFNNDTQSHVYSVRIIAHDNNNNAILQQDLGSVYVNPSDVTKFIPNRIADFHLESILEPSLDATLMWTAPGGALDHGSASAYYMKCDPDFHNISNMTENKIPKQPKNKLSITPANSGSNESFHWEIPLPNTVYYCVIISENEHGRVSEKSNIVSVFAQDHSTSSSPQQITTSTVIPSTTENSNSSRQRTDISDLSLQCNCNCSGEISGIGILSALVVILLGALIYLLRKIRLENTLKNPLPNFNAKPLPRLDITKPPCRLDAMELQPNPNSRLSNIYQAADRTTVNPELHATTNFVYQDEATIDTESCIYDEIRELPECFNSSYVGDDEYVVGRKDVVSLPPMKDCSQPLPLPKKKERRSVT